MVTYCFALALPCIATLVSRLNRLKSTWIHRFLLFLLADYPSLKRPFGCKLSLAR